MTAVLDGVKVLELGTFITGPCAGMLLADLGAEVTKVEQPGTGDPFRSYQGSLYSPQFRAYNACKQSLTLNLKNGRGQEIFLRLAQEADVIIENYRPGVADALGVGWTVIRELNDRLVYCSITGFGADGPYAGRPCYDTVAQGLSGYLSQFADSHNPRIAGPAVADAITGMYAGYGILGALYERQTTGKGRRVEVAMLDSLIAFGAEPFASYAANGKAPKPYTRASVSQSYALSCSDEKLLALHLASPEKFWRSLLDAIQCQKIGDDPRFNSRERRVLHYEALKAELQAVFSSRPRKHWLERLAAHDVPHAPVATLDEVTADPHVRHAGIFETFHHPAEGRVAHIRRPVLIDGDRNVGGTAPPTLGQHSATILAELGYAAGEIEQLKQQGVI